MVSATSYQSFYRYDTSVSVSDTDTNPAVKQLNCEVKVISKWLKTNRFKLNPNKTETMVIYSNRWLI